MTSKMSCPPGEEPLVGAENPDSAVGDLRSHPTPSYRASSQGLEEILYKSFPVLDHGFIRVVDYMGNDDAIVQAARVSYGRGTKKTLQDQGLIHYLMRHRHTTPFEMCEIKFHIKLPMFVARQWVRHRASSINEYSARYSVLDREFYIPEPQNLATQSSLNRQGRGGTFGEADAKRALDLLKRDAAQCYDTYEDLLNSDHQGRPLDPDRASLARELARINLPVGFYTQWYWKINLHNLLHFLSLRADPHAQHEIRVYALIMLDIVKKWVPHTYEAFVNYRLEAASLSKAGLNVLKRLLAGEAVAQENSGMGVREWREFEALFLKK